MYKILDEQYILCFIYDPPSKGWTAYVKEFPGCICEGDTISEALERLCQVSESWIEAALAQGQEIPEPEK